MSFVCERIWAGRSEGALEIGEPVTFPEVERRAVKRTLNGAFDPLLPVILLRSGPWWISLNGQKPTKLLAAPAMNATQLTLAR